MVGLIEEYELVVLRFSPVGVDVVLSPIWKSLDEDVKKQVRVTLGGSD